MPLHVSSTRAHRQEAKIVLYNLWYHHTETSEWSKITKIQFYKYEHIVANLYVWNAFKLVLSEPVHGTATYRCDDTRGCVIQF